MSNGVKAYGKIKVFVVKIGINIINKMQENKRHEKISQTNLFIKFFKSPPNLIFVLILI